MVWETLARPGIVGLTINADSLKINYHRSERIQFLVEDIILLKYFSPDKIHSSTYYLRCCRK